MIAYAPATEVVGECFRYLVPANMPPMDEFLRREYRDRRGRAFIEGQVPWTTAPGGPCDAADNPKYRELWLQWAARMFKTTFHQCAMARQAVYAPVEMMYATRDEKLLKQVFARYYQQLDRMPLMRGQLPVESKRSSSRIRFSQCQIIGTWAGSQSGLADESIKVGAAGEVDKWDLFETSTEGDPLPRFLKRGGEFPDRKFYIESTPGKKGVSRVERGRLTGTNHEYHVPCPHCGVFQKLVFGDQREPPGIFWDENADIAKAASTAHYRCLCGGRIEEEHRFELVNRGVWVPEGCTADSDLALRARDMPRFCTDWLNGTPARDGIRYSSQISIWYAPFVSWGDVVEDYLLKQDKEADRRQWKNEEAGETWDILQRRKRWQDLYERLKSDVDRDIIPEWASELTAAIDRQADFYVWGVWAWGPGRRHHLVSYGDAFDLTWIRNNVLAHSFEHADGGVAMRPSLTLIDNGFRPDSHVEDFCEECVSKHALNVWTCEGSETSLGSDYLIAEKGPRTTRPGLMYVRVDTQRTQEWIEDVLHGRDPDVPGAGSLHAVDDPELHQDLLEQLLNEEQVDKPTTTNHTRLRWERIVTSVPNDMRDIWRYAFVAMQEITRNKPLRPRGSNPPEREARDEHKETSEHPNTW